MSLLLLLLLILFILFIAGGVFISHWVFILVVAVLVIALFTRPWGGSRVP